MKPEEIKKIKKALLIIKLAMNANRSTFYAMIGGWPFRKAKKLLEEAINWSQKDEETVNELGEKIEKGVEGKSLNERSLSLDKILKTELAA